MTAPQSTAVRPTAPHGLASRPANHRPPRRATRDVRECTGGVTVPDPLRGAPEHHASRDESLRCFDRLRREPLACGVHGVTRNVPRRALHASVTRVFLTQVPAQALRVDVEFRCELLRRHVCVTPFRHAFVHGRTVARHVTQCNASRHVLHSRHVAHKRCTLRQQATSPMLTTYMHDVGTPPATPPGVGHAARTSPPRACQISELLEMPRREEAHG